MTDTQASGDESDRTDSMPPALPDTEPSVRSVTPHFSDLDVYGALSDHSSESSERIVPSRRVNWMLVVPLLVIVLLGLVYVFIMPEIEHKLRVWWNPKKARGELLMESPQLEIFRTCEYVTVLWFVYFGASIGSFFNVVASRLPRGRGIVFGGSKCPSCDHKLKFIHNTPLIGWLWCRGQCAFCKAPIAFRYLWMELLVGFLFLSVAFVELFSGGANLPRWLELPYTGIVYTVFYPKWLLIGAFAVHAFLFASISMLLATNLENARFPWKAWLVFVACHIVVRVLGGETYGLRWGDGLLDSATLRGFVPWQSVVLTLGTGAAVGLGIGWLTGRLLPVERSSPASQHWSQASFLIGCVLGWQAVLIIVLVSFGAVRIVDWLFGSRWKSVSWQTFSQLGILLTLAITHHFAWRQLAILYGIRS